MDNYSETKVDITNQLYLDLFLNSLNAKEMESRHSDDPFLTYYLRRTQQIITAFVEERKSYMNILSNNQIKLRDGTIIQLPTSGNIKLRMTSSENKITKVVSERVFLNGKEFKDGKFRVTFMAILNYLFG